MEMAVVFSCMCFVSHVYTNHTKAPVSVRNKREYILLAVDKDLPAVSTVISKLAFSGWYSSIILELAR